jgi:hypothetical protein
MFRRVLVGAAVASVLVEAIVVGRRRGSFIDPATPVQCRDGHLFTTIWIPGASVKSLRLGWWRFQRCPVGNHWTLVTPLDTASATDQELALAADHRDVRLP